MDDYTEFDVIEFTQDIPEDGISKGQRGTILIVYDERYFEVEIADDYGKTIFLGPVAKENFKLHWKFKDKTT